MGKKITVWLTGLIYTALMVGCMSGHSGQQSAVDRSKRFARDASAPTSASSDQEDYQSTGSGKPDQREVPALIAGVNLPEAPRVTEEQQPVLSDSPKVYTLKVNDGVVINLRGIPREDQIEVVVDENGYISLPFLDAILAAGKTSSELEQTVRDAYVLGKIYKSVTVNVMLPTQNYFIRGEVQRPSRLPLVPGTTILQAVATAGGYTEYANARKIKVVRGDTFFFVDAKELEMHPELDKVIEAGDVIVVPRGVF